MSLNFVGRPASPSALVGELWEAHQEVTQGWFAFDAFLNAGLKTTDLLASGNGILATGPRPFLDRYAAVLKRHGLRVASVGEGEPRQWRDGAWRPEKADLRALVLDDSYIIGRDLDGRASTRVAVEHARCVEPPAHCLSRAPAHPRDVLANWKSSAQTEVGIRQETK